MRLKMRLSKIFFLCGIVLLFLCVAAAANAADKYDNFAKCLTSKGISMYGDFRCPHCAEQKKLFGDSFQYVHYLECGTRGQPMTLANQQQACREAQIKHYPTWTFQDGDRLETVQTLEKLSEKTGCKLP